MYEADAPYKVGAICSVIEGRGLHPTTILDVGCGSGTVLAGVCGRLGARGVGIDIDPATADAAGFPGVEFRVGDVFETDLSADLVLCIDVFEHIEDDVGFLRRLRERGRWFLFRIPLDDSVWDRARGRTERFRTEYGHLHAYTRAVALSRLTDAGYEVRDVRPHRIPAGGLAARGVRRVAEQVAPRLACRVIGGWSLLVLARERR